MILNLFSGDYNNANGVSALARERGYGVIDVDNHTDYGRGQLADISANSVYAFLLALVEAQRIVGVFCAQNIYQNE